MTELGNGNLHITLPSVEANIALVSSAIRLGGKNAMHKLSNFPYDMLVIGVLSLFGTAKDRRPKKFLRWCNGKLYDKMRGNAGRAAAEFPFTCPFLTSCYDD